MLRALVFALALWGCADDAHRNGELDARHETDSEAEVGIDTSGELDGVAEVEAEDGDAPHDSRDVDEPDLEDAAEDIKDAFEGDDGPDTSDAELEVGTLPAAHSIAGPLTLEAPGTLPFLTPSELFEVLVGRFSVGRELFVAEWTPAPDPTRPLIDGVGPLFHATSCVACHPARGRPSSVLAGGAVHFGILMRLARPEGEGWAAGDPVFGSQFQTGALAPTPAEGVVTWLADLLATPTHVPEDSPALVYTLAPNPSYGPLAAATRAGPRLSPHLAGMGLLDLVPEDVLLAFEDPDDLDGDGVSGRAARLLTAEGPRLGRFGWKAVKSSLKAQTAAAFVGDIGITSPLHPEDDCSPAQVSCRETPAGGSPEVSVADLDAVDEFMSYLGVPPARRVDGDPQIERGHRRFVEVGCATCHRPALETGDAPHLPPLARIRFYPYTDLLLHDMGPELSDPIGEGDASPAEWRTPPLWGVGLVETQADARFLHDGRAKTLEAAILWHGGEGEGARERYRRLEPRDREDLLAFLRSL